MVKTPATGWPGRLWTLQPWRYLKLNCTKPSVAWVNPEVSPAFGRGLDQMTSKDPFQSKLSCEPLLADAIGSDRWKRRLWHPLASDTLMVNRTSRYWLFCVFFPLLLHFPRKAYWSAACSLNCMKQQQKSSIQCNLLKSLKGTSADFYKYRTELI